MEKDVGLASFVGIRISLKVSYACIACVSCKPFWSLPSGATKRVHRGDKGLSEVYDPAADKSDHAATSVSGRAAGKGVHRI